MDNFLSVLVLVVGYVYFVTKGGRLIMENRQPFELKTFMQFYNVVQVLINFSFASYVWNFFGFSKFEYKNFISGHLLWSLTSKFFMEMWATCLWYWFSFNKYFNLCILLFVHQNPWSRWHCYNGPEEEIFPNYIPAYLSSYCDCSLCLQFK